MKIVGIGLNKTGTTTLGTCLVHWGLNHIGWNPDAFTLWRENNIAELLNWVDRYDSFEDWPWPLIFPEIDEAFPGSKFILTRRKDPETWYRSLCKHSELKERTDKYVYGFNRPHGHRRELIEYYENHLLTVRDYFRDRPGDLLEVCWEDGDGWEALARFLGFEVPTKPFPHTNKSPSRKTRLKRWIKQNFLGIKPE
ncbi:MAG: hypothetical protein IGR92_08820 [Leptolyngbyaceae cyanobacterium T60_A2020_046]|nr:hypothetical protein [Leptolyngbyaceae cyanobacterium T60_A2020_046]